MTPIRIAMALATALVGSVVLATIHPWGDLRSEQAGTFLGGSSAPGETRAVIEATCGDCHSDSTHWPIYSRVAPASWLLERDVREGRSHLNLSQWQQYGAERQAELLSRIAAEVRSGQMPVKRYLLLHPKARLSPQQQQLIYDWARAERRQLRKELAEKHGVGPAEKAKP